MEFHAFDDSGRDLRVLELYSGIGGMHYALEGEDKCNGSFGYFEMSNFDRIK